MIYLLIISFFSIVLPLLIVRWVVGVLGFTKSRSDRVIAGVLGGIARQLNIDSTVLRVIWIILIFFAGFGVGTYILLWIFMPVGD
ncbi:MULTISPECIES: PspC domain-containing protein [unclassified Enterococcus]|uniref:PspC domain-containing protein n=1 Tax=unclassified Enterococcus TaxID=2608891 RepID=UPI0015526188|nr:MULTISPECIES: PspC domain-containing protein [unclassified Enterococcus]MBS7577027.1 PspC domain-containing protein [Enterococcus sp. MMGLQ5-2]MBS7584526.1 PspC domain-containing protein [Enterococcus sp. MMGLQ5-1]NPD12381.1 PspC domain-containing protein [Enterococcus sp. MMGLQ5-1]NPD36861.1 PspC domain-containing protein [Enterococcus sp. MMGLQ5-2]